MKQSDFDKAMLVEFAVRDSVTVPRYDEAKMKAAIEVVKAKFPDAHCIRVGKSKKNIRVYWIIRDRNIPTEVLGRGDCPHNAWIHAKESL